MRVTRLLRAPSRLFRTALVTVPLPKTLLAQLRQLVPDVRSVPFQGPDRVVGHPLPTAEDYADANAILAWEVPEQLKEAAQTPRLRLFQGYKTGYSDITASEYFKSVPEASDTIFASASGIPAPNIAEHVLGSVLTLTHKIHTAARLKRWADYSEVGGFFIRELPQLTVGICGYGAIGRETARIFKACGSNVIALTRSGKPASQKGYCLPGCGDLEGGIPSAWYSTESRSSTLEFFATCDVVVNILPDSQATRGFVGREELKAMKGNAIYVNVGRGSTTDQEALIEALGETAKEGEEEEATGTLRIGAAALDVVTPEPLPSSSPLWSLDNAIVTMHWSGASAQYHRRALELFMENIRRIDSGEGAYNVYRGRGVKP